MPAVSVASGDLEEEGAPSAKPGHRNRSCSDRATAADSGNQPDHNKAPEHCEREKMLRTKKFVPFSLMR